MKSHAFRHQTDAASTPQPAVHRSVDFIVSSGLSRVYLWEPWAACGESFPLVSVRQRLSIPPQQRGKVLTTCLSVS